MKRSFFERFLRVLCCLLAGPVFAQQVQVTLGPDEIGENQAWTITVTANNTRLSAYDNFPDIDGFRKRGTSSSSQTSIVNGQISSSQSVIMSYLPVRQGTFTVPAFKMKVNDQMVSVTGKKVRVGPAVQAQSADPFASFFNRDPANDMFNRGTTEFVDVNDNAQLVLSTNKDEIYVGEGFTTTLSFLAADNDRAPMQFYELSKQLGEILKKIKPPNCWEENFNIENIEGDPVIINGRNYTQYKIYEATFYPLNTKSIVFPSVPLEMIKYKVAKDPSFFGQNRQLGFKTFYSREKRVAVKELPPHPMRDAVAVGDYRLDERLNRNHMETGQSVGYEFNIYGEGNISAIDKPVVKKDDNLEFYEPTIRQQINRDNNRVTGTKSFGYFMIPKEPGNYALKDYFQWVFFNPHTKKYDTLRPAQTIEVTGTSQKNLAIESNDLGPFYDRIETADNSLQHTSGSHWMQLASNIFILLMLGGSVYLVFKK
jgi:hypothetical protein